MGCFSLFPCFTSSNQSKSNKSSSADQGCKNNRESVLIKVPTEESANTQSLEIPIWISRDNSEGQLINDNDSKISDIDLDVETNENVEILSIENERKKEKQNNLGVEVEVKIENDDKMEMIPKEEDQSFVGGHVELEKEVKTEVDSRAISDSSASSYISYPPMHRYHNRVINEDEEDQVVIQEDSSESLFSLSIDPRRQSRTCSVEVDDKEVNSPLKTSSSTKKIVKSTSFCANENDNSQTIDSLLNPIENLAQWKTLKAIPKTSYLDLHQEKENLYLEQEDIPIPVSEDPSFKVSDTKGKVKNDTAVTTSLSSWLVDPVKSITASKEESQYSTGNSNSYAYSDATSWKSFEDRPILGAWTIDEVKQISARSSPRKSPCRNPDETPIIGTVGSYWSHTMQATDSSSSCTSPFGMSAKSRRIRQSKALSCHSSPTKRRLERAFNKTAV